MVHGSLDAAWETGFTGHVSWMMTHGRPWTAVWVFDQEMIEVKTCRPFKL